MGYPENLMNPKLPESWIQAAKDKWRFRGSERPPFAQQPAAGQESVWDYPRPPRLMSDSRRVIVRVHKKVLADSCKAIRILETASPPTFYLPPGDVDLASLMLIAVSSFCEWKGTAQYWSLKEGEERGEPVAWGYPHPFREFEPIAHYVAYYPGRVECYVDDERVQPQASGIYGGWVTKEIVGPFKGPPETENW